MKNGLMNRIKDVFAGLTGKNRFERLDFVILKTALMLAAADGEVATDEFVRFKDLTTKCCGYSGETFEALWDEALRSAGYILLQSRFLDHEGLVAVFARRPRRTSSARLSLRRRRSGYVRSTSWTGWRWPMASTRRSSVIASSPW